MKYSFLFFYVHLSFSFSYFQLFTFVLNHLAKEKERERKKKIFKIENFRSFLLPLSNYIFFLLTEIRGFFSFPINWLWQIYFPSSYLFTIFLGLAILHDFSSAINGHLRGKMDMYVKLSHFRIFRISFQFWIIALWKWRWKKMWILFMRHRSIFSVVFIKIFFWRKGCLRMADKKKEISESILVNHCSVTLN